MATRRQISLIQRGPGFKVVADAVRLLAEREVLVGYPAETSERKADEDGQQPELTNAALGYIHENGDPERNIPERPHLGPGVARVSDAIQTTMRRIAKQTLDGNPEAIEQGLHQVGLKAKVSAQNMISEGIPPPLADATLLARTRRASSKGAKGAKKELERRAQGLKPSTEFAKPLLETSQLRSAINYVIRDRRERS